MRASGTQIGLCLLALVLIGCSDNDLENIDDLGVVFTSASSGAGDEPRELRLSWTVLNEPDSYRIEVNPDGSSGFTPADVNGDGVVDNQDLVDGSANKADVPLALHKTDFNNALYRVVAVDANGNELASADDISLTDVAVEDLIGYFKASNTESGDSFGGGVAISTDGATLAIAADNEDSSSAGINGNQRDNNTQGSGAVYVFTRAARGGWSQQAYVKASNPDEFDGFGEGAVALSDNGDTLAVGALQEESSATGINGDDTDNSLQTAGAAYVFVRDADGNWAQQAYVKASNTDSNDRFGTSVALSGSGDTLAVGARGEESSATGINGDETDNSLFEPGAVYVFTRDAQGTWAQQAYVKASNTGDTDEFGQSVALSSDGDTLAVGARGEESAATGVGGDQSDNSAVDAGAGYVFTRDDQGLWSQQAYLKASNTDANDFFGWSVALSGDGDTLAVGAPDEASSATGIGGDQTDNSAGGAGAVYVFVRDDQGSWSQQAYAKASNTDAGDDFGDALALSGGPGDTLAVGAFEEASSATGINGDEGDNSFDDSTIGNAGAGYLFTRDDQGNWSQRAYVKASNTDAGDRFGKGLALSGDGDVLAVGATDEDSSATGIGGIQSENSAEDAGAAYLY